MAQDPFEKYIVTEEPKTEEDPFKKYIVKEEMPITADPIDEKGLMDLITTSLLPNLPEREPVTPENLESFPIRAAKEMGRGVYEDLIQPMASPLGIGVTAFGGPIARGAMRIGSKLAPGAVEAVSGILNKPLFGTASKAAPVAKKILPEAVNPIVDEIAQPIEEVITSPVDKLTKALQEAKPLTRKQAQIYTSERAEKFGSARNTPFTTQEESKGFMGKLSGQHTKVSMEPLKLDQTDVDSLYGMINEKLQADIIDVPESARAITSLGKLLEGAVPQASELEVLNRVLGQKLAVPQSLSKRELLLRTVSVPKAIVSSLDFGFPFRQGVNYVGRKEWAGMFKPMIQSYFSEGSKDKWLNVIKTGRNFDKQRRSGLAIYDDLSTAREEHVLNSWIQELPGVKHSNRAYTVAGSKLRHDLWNTMYDDYKRLFESQLKLAGNDESLISNAELLNPDNYYRQKLMSDSINTGTGRGSIGRLEPIAEELNAVLFSPRLMSSRFKSINKTLNPMSYYNGDPIERKDALKQLLSITGTALTSASLFKLAGGEVNLDIRSSDYLKGKIGNTRFDMGGGYLQYLVPAAKILSGTAVGIKSGKSYDLSDKNPVTPNRWDTLESFITNKASPLASLFVALMRGREATGKEVNLESLSPFENTALKTFMPIMIQDFKELKDEDPGLLPLMIPSSLGGSIQVHSEEKKVKRR